MKNVVSLAGSRTPLSRARYMTGGCTSRYTTRDCRYDPFFIMNKPQQSADWPFHTNWGITLEIQFRFGLNQTSTALNQENQGSTFAFRI